MRIVFTIIFFLLSYFAKADESRIRFEHHSNNKRFVLQLMTYKNRVCGYNDLYESTKRKRSKLHWRVIDSLTKTELYRFPNKFGGHFISWQVYISDNGQNIVAIDDYSGLNEFKDSTELLQFYDKNKLIATYKANQILYSLKNITHSASHISFVLREKLDSLNKEFQLETKEMIKFRFSVETGLIISKDKHPLLNSENIRVYGEIKSTEIDTVYKMEICGIVYGKMPITNVVTFIIHKSDTKNPGYFQRRYQTIFIKNNVYIPSAYQYENCILNNCDKSDKY